VRHRDLDGSDAPKKRRHRRRRGHCYPRLRRPQQIRKPARREEPGDVFAELYSQVPELRAGSFRREYASYSLEKATVLKVKGLGGEQSAKERGRASRR